MTIRLVSRSNLRKVTARVLLSVQVWEEGCKQEPLMSNFV